MLIYSKRSPSGCLASCPMWANIPRYIHPPHRPIPRPRGTHAHLHVHRHTGDFITNPAQKRRHATHRCALKMWTVCWQRQQATGAGKPPCTMKSKCTQVQGMLRRENPHSVLLSQSRLDQNGLSFNKQQTNQNQNQKNSYQVWYELFQLFKRQRPIKQP